MKSEQLKLVINITSRELFAAMAMEGYIACPETQGSIEEIVKVSVKYADYLIKELAKPQP